MAVLVAVRCPHCQSSEVVRHGKSSSGKLPLFGGRPVSNLGLNSAYPGRNRSEAANSGDDTQW